MTRSPATNVVRSQWANRTGQTSGRPRGLRPVRRAMLVLAHGSSNAEIANQLYVSTETVKTHVAHVLRKLDVPNRSSAVEKATRLGLLV